MNAWTVVTKYNRDAAALADRHYSRQSVGARQFMPPGDVFVLLSTCARAVWGVCCNLPPRGALRWRVTLFRNEGAGLSSSLIIEATAATFDAWEGKLPPVPLTTEIDPDEVRRKRDPGRCFLKAGWIRLGYHVRAKRTKGHVLLVAPGELERVHGRRVIAIDQFRERAVARALEVARG